MGKDTVEVPVAWIKRLLELSERLRDTWEYEMDVESVTYLQGYIESAKEFVSTPNTKRGSVNE